MNPIHNLKKVKIQDFSWRHVYVCNSQCTIGSPQSSGFHWPNRIKNFPMIDSSLMFAQRMENFTQIFTTKFVPSSFQIDRLSQSEAMDVGNSSRFYRLIKEWLLSHREQDQLGVEISHKVGNNSAGIISPNSWSFFFEHTNHQ